MSKRGYPEDEMEPSAALVGDQYRYTKSSDQLALRSIAISLKRIADLEERMLALHEQQARDMAEIKSRSRP